jgi:ubiquinone/menaquinone biosynthesis C-methylase UbiE
MNAQITALRERPSYQPGDLENEIRRLELRATVLIDFSLDALHRAGIEPGMRVVDLGCSVGYTSLQIAKLVGPSGLVVGVDPSEQAIHLAEMRATVAGQCYWARFVSADLDEFFSARRFDAVVFRSKRERPNEPAANFPRLSALVRRGGIVLMIPC